jgi:hypothetical protein
MTTATATKQAAYYEILGLTGDKATRIRCETMSDAQDIADGHELLGSIYSMFVVFTDGTKQVIA